MTTNPHAEPRDIVPPPLDAEDLRHLAETSPSWWRGATGTVSVVPLGRGESYRAWLLRRGADGDAEKLVARVPHKPLAELPLPPAAELEILRRVPPGLSAAPVAALEPTARDPRTLVVTTLVPGRVLPAAMWTDSALLEGHARTLAHLHAAGDRRGMPVPGRPDPVADAQAARAWWRDHEPESAAAVVEPLWPGLERYLTARRAAFAEADAVLLHGDPAAANCLVSGLDPAGERSGEPLEVRLVDWEWAQVGDGARDLAFIGGALHAEPWYAALDPEQIRAHAEAYLDERARRAADGSPVPVIGPLLERREAHLLHEGLFTAAHLFRVAAAGEQGAETERAARTSQSLCEQIAAVVGD